MSLRVDDPDAVVSATSSNQALLPDADLTVSGRGEDRRLGIVAKPRRAGDTTITVVAQGDGGSVSLAVEVAVGTARPQRLVGGAGPDVLFGRDGADTLKGVGGVDLLCGGNGADRLDGGDGGDALFGQDGRDILIGGPAADRFSGGKGRDTLVDLDPAEGDTTDGSRPRLPPDPRSARSKGSPG